ncbi:MAG: alpha/beta hydrolase-fold protein [Ignavibacteriaceae bacterium]|jgi:predicted alpha/beta superfamily hydrolase
MLKFKHHTLLILISFILIKVVSAQEISDAEDKTNLYNTQVKVFHSTIIDDDFYIYISLPDGYEESVQKYPVLYLLDGDIAFGMAASIARYLQFGNTIPELIIVGVGYGALKKSKGNDRNRDYTISNKRNRPGSGGAPKFRKFLEEELIPYIDDEFRTVPDDRTLNGYSLGGLFALYTLFTEPGLFNRYIIGSPHLAWDNFRIFSVQENAFNSIDDINARVFISVGSEQSQETYFEPIDSMVTIIQEKGYPNLKLDTKVFDGGTHLICPPEALTYGLVAVFSE